MKKDKIIIEAIDLGEQVQCNFKNNTKDQESFRTLTLAVIRSIIDGHTKMNIAFLPIILESMQLLIDDYVKQEIEKAGTREFKDELEEFAFNIGMAVLVEDYNKRHGDKDDVQ